MKPTTDRQVTVETDEDETEEYEGKEDFWYFCLVLVGLFIAAMVVSLYLKK